MDLDPNRVQQLQCGIGDKFQRSWQDPVRPFDQDDADIAVGVESLHRLPHPGTAFGHQVLYQQTVATTAHGYLRHQVQV
jgi:hypothetical protein